MINLPVIGLLKRIIQSKIIFDKLLNLLRFYIFLCILIIFY